MRQGTRWLTIVGSGLVLAAGWQLWSSGQQPQPDKAQDARPATRLEFDVVESYDAKYLGDTPGHMGRAGSLTDGRLKIALEDPIYRGAEVVGRVTGLQWNRTNASLDIEFDPVGHARVCVGDRVWIARDGSTPARASEPSPAK